MTDPNKLFGRMGNRMFQMAALYAHSKGIGSDIYFQDEKYFKKYEKEIKQLFGEGIGYLSQVGIHYRKGDYKDNNFYIQLDETQYYQQAIKIFPDKNFLIFSDEPDLAQVFFEQILDKNKFQVMERTNEVEDFNLLASCSDIIMANSSWSWWAAFLCPNHVKKIIAPSVKNWYTDGIERTVCPFEWIRI